MRLNWKCYHPGLHYVETFFISICVRKIARAKWYLSIFIGGEHIVSTHAKLAKAKARAQWVVERSLKLKWSRDQHKVYHANKELTIYKHEFGKWILIEDHDDVFAWTEFNTLKEAKATAQKRHIQRALDETRLDVPEGGLKRFEAHLRRLK